MSSKGLGPGLDLERSKLGREPQKVVQTREGTITWGGLDLRRSGPLDPNEGEV